MIRRLACIPDLVRVERLSPEALRRLQDRRVRRLVHHAYREVPFYRERFDAAGVRPDDISGCDDLRLLPVTTKRQMRDAGPVRTVAQSETLDSLRTVRTSGTSGDPFTVWLTPLEHATRTFAAMWPLRAIGLKPRNTLVVVGHVWRFRHDFLQRLGLYRRYQIPPLDSTQSQIEQLRRLRPDVIWTTPTYLMTIREAVDDLFTVCRPQVIVTTGESASPSLSHWLGSHDGLAYFNWYGASETGRIAWECPAHEGLHVAASRIVLERVPSAAQAREDIGEAIVTVLDQFAMPFIRYQLGDLIGFRNRPCSCGRTSPLIGPPLGRSWELVRLPGGQTVSSHRFAMTLKGITEIRQYRVVQKELGRLVVLVTCSGAPSADLLTRVEAAVREAAGDEVRVGSAGRRIRGESDRNRAGAQVPGLRFRTLG